MKKLTFSDRTNLLADYAMGQPVSTLAKTYGLHKDYVRRVAMLAGVKHGADAYSPHTKAAVPDAALADPERPAEAPAFTRRCANKDCIERFVPVNSQHRFHETACGASTNLWTWDEVLREEGSLLPSSNTFDLAKRAFGQKNRVLRQLQERTSLNEYIANEVRTYYEDNPEYRWPSVPKVKSDPPMRPSRGERVVLVQLSDWQIGKLEEGIGVDEMRVRVERIKGAVRSVVERQRAAGYSVKKVVNSWGGDMIEGCYIYGGQNVNGLDRTGNTHRLVTQVRVAATWMAELAMDEASYVEEVQNYDVPGNHGRTNGRNDFSDPKDNFDSLAAYIAEILTAQESRISWEHYDDWWGSFDILGHRFVSFHGDQWRGPFQKLEELLPKWVTGNVFGSLARPEVVLTHHRHDLATIRVGGIQVVQNGTIDGGSGWYLRAFGKSSPPAQMIHVVSERRATESLWPVDFS